MLSNVWSPVGRHPRHLAKLYHQKHQNLKNHSGIWPRALDCWLRWPKSVENVPLRTQNASESQRVSICKITVASGLERSNFVQFLEPGGPPPSASSQIVPPKNIKICKITVVSGLGRSSVGFDGPKVWYCRLLLASMAQKCGTVV